MPKPLRGQMDGRLMEFVGLTQACATARDYIDFATEIRNLLVGIELVFVAAEHI